MIAERAELHKALDAGRGEIERLERIIAALKQKIFGTGQSEKVDHEQLTIELNLAEIELEQLQVERVLKGLPADDADEKKPEPKKREKQVRRYAFPEHMEVVTETILPQAVQDEPDAYREVGKPEVTELLDVRPMQFIKRRIVRPRFVRIDDRAAAPLVAPTPPRVLSGGLPGTELLVLVILSKYMDHLPLYRQAQIFASRYQVELNRKILGNWIRAVAEDWLSIIYHSIKSDLQKETFLHADETPITCLDPDDQRGSRKGYLWGYVDGQGNCLYDWHMSRSKKAAAFMLCGYRGLLQADAYGVYQSLSAEEGFLLIACIAHVRRKFHEAWDQANQRAAGWYILHIAKLYKVERRIKQTQADKVTMRIQHSLPILNQIKLRLEQDEQLLPKRSKTYEAVRYMLNVWPNLQRYIYYTQANIDNNPAEQAVRCTKLGMKNWLFIGHPKAGKRAAIIYTIVQNCKNHGLDPRAYLIDVLKRLPRMNNNTAAIRALQPRFWKPEN